MIEHTYYFKNNPSKYPNRYIKIKNFFRSNSIYPYRFIEDGTYIIWKENVGRFFEFRYEDITGKMKIVDYQCPYIYIQYLNHPPHRMTVSTLLGCKLGGYLSYIGISLPGLVPFLYNEEEKYIKTVGMDKKIKFVCSCCGEVFEGVIRTICTRFKNGVEPVCKLCNDGISTPTKYCMAFLNQLNISYKMEKKFEWSNGKRYDFVFTHEEKLYIVEIHGGQHYMESFSKLGGRRLDEEVENDKVKRKLALDNGVDEYIEVNCKITNQDYLKDQFLKSFSIHGFQCTEIDYEECWRASLSSIKKKCYEMWDSKQNITTTDIASELGVNYATVGRWLKERKEGIGRFYDGQNERIKACIRTGVNRRKEVIAIDKNNVIKEYDSLRSCFYELGEALGFKCETQVSKICRKNKNRVNNPKTKNGYALFLKEDYERGLNI